MTTRIDPTASSRIETARTAARTSEAPARPFRAVLQEGSSAVVRGAEAAVRGLPGGPILAAAVRQTPSGSDSTPGSPEGSGGTATASESSADPMGGVLDAQAKDNLYYLQLQARISAESRAYSATSNVLKARHDTVKNAINNIR